MSEGEKIVQLTHYVASFISDNQKGFGYSDDLGFYTFAFLDGNVTYTIIGKTLDEALVWFREWSNQETKAIVNRLKKLNFSEVYEI